MPPAHTKRAHSDGLLFVAAFPGRVERKHLERAQGRGAVGAFHSQRLVCGKETGGHGDLSSVYECLCRGAIHQDLHRFDATGHRRGLRTAGHGTICQDDRRAVKMESEHGPLRNVNLRYDMEQVSGRCQRKRLSGVKIRIFPHLRFAVQFDDFRHRGAIDAQAAGSAADGSGQDSARTWSRCVPGPDCTKYTGCGCRYRTRTRPEADVFCPTRVRRYCRGRTRPRRTGRLLRSGGLPRRRAAVPSSG